MDNQRKNNQTNDKSGRTSPASADQGRENKKQPNQEWPTGKNKQAKKSSDSAERGGSRPFSH